jgi:hypothetical protein
MKGQTWMDQVDASGDCWLWTGPIAPNGYGSTTVDNRTRIAHRAVYEKMVGPIPAGLELDHLCRVRHCVNPDHLEPVTRSVNLLRGVGPILKKAAAAARTHCTNGHELTPENTILSAGKWRICRICRKKHRHEYHLRTGK